MKNVVSLFLAVVLLLSMTACNAGTRDNADASADPQPQISTTTTAAPASYVPKPSLPNLIGRAPKSIDTWTVETVSNYVPFTPDGYNGQMADYTCRYTDTSGEVSEKTYHVAFISTLEEADSYAYDNRLHTEATVNGETKSGFVLQHVEKLFFLQKERIDGDVTRYYLDADLPYTIWYANVLSTNSEKALISAGSYLLVYTFGSKKCELITKDAFDYKYVSDDGDGLIFYTDWDHNEYVCSWSKSAESGKTGKTVLNYYEPNFELTEDPTFKNAFESDFSTMQNALREGTAKEDSFSHMYSIYSFGSIYDTAGYYLSNIHLPKPYDYNTYAMYFDYGACWLTEGNTINRYCYGKVDLSYDLDDGLWSIIVAETDPVQILLYNAKDQCVYLFDGVTKKLEKLATDVVDFREAYGELYWMDSLNNAYELTWEKSSTSVLIGTEVVGISRHTDERAGFVVKPGDPRCNAVSDGFSLCTLYGDDWLNQEFTSGAWALEYDWHHNDATT